jgi:hypothetical protein
MKRGYCTSRQQASHQISRRFFGTAWVAALGLVASTTTALSASAHHMQMMEGISGPKVAAAAEALPRSGWTATASD